METWIVDARLLESSESYKAASQRASLEVERLRAENEDLKQQIDAGFALSPLFCFCTVVMLDRSKFVLFYIVVIVLKA